MSLLGSAQLYKCGYQNPVRRIPIRIHTGRFLCQIVGFVWLTTKEITCGSARIEKECARIRRTHANGVLEAGDSLGWIPTVNMRPTDQHGHKRDIGIEFERALCSLDALPIVTCDHHQNEPCCCHHVGIIPVRGYCSVCECNRGSGIILAVRYPTAVQTLFVPPG